MTDEEQAPPPPPPPPSPWIFGVLRQPLSVAQTLVGILAGLLSIGGALVSLTSVGATAPRAQGEIVASVHDRVSKRPVADASVEILTREDALVTTLTPESGGRLARRLNEGRYRLRVSHPAFGTEVRHVEVHAGQRSEVRIALAPRTPARVVRTASDDTPGPVRKFFKELGF